jgi:hypothetical protein
LRKLWTSAPKKQRIGAAIVATASVSVATGLALSMAQATESPLTKVGTQQELDAYLKQKRNGNNTFDVFHYVDNKGRAITGDSPAKLCKDKKAGEKFEGQVDGKKVTGTCRFTQVEAPEKQYAGAYVRVSSVIDNSCSDEDTADFSIDRGMARSQESSESKEFSGGLMDVFQFTVGKTWTTSQGETRNQGERSGFVINPGKQGWIEMSPIKRAGVMRIEAWFKDRIADHHAWYYYLAAATPDTTLQNGMPDGVIRRREVDSPCPDGPVKPKPKQEPGGDPFGGPMPPEKPHPDPFGKPGSAQKPPPPQPVVTAKQCQDKKLVCLFKEDKFNPASKAVWSAPDKSGAPVPLSLKVGLSTKSALNATTKAVGLLDWDGNGHCLPPGKISAPLPKGFPENLDTIQVAAGKTCPKLGK